MSENIDFKISYNFTGVSVRMPSPILATLSKQEYILTVVKIRKLKWRKAVICLLWQSDKKDGF